MQTEPWLDFKDAIFGWKRNQPVFGPVNLQLKKYRIAWLFGASGVGKSSMLRVIAGHVLLSSGSCEVFGETVDQPGPSRGIALQDHKLFPWMNIYDNVAFGPRQLGKDEAEIEERVMSLLKRVGLGDVATAWPYQLSGGMRQRVSILRSLAGKPRCLLLDEPFSSIDAENAEKILDIINELLTEPGHACLIASHIRSYSERQPCYRIHFDETSKITLFESGA